MTTELQGVKINPIPEEEDLRRMSRAINNLVEFSNRGFIERTSNTSTGTPVTDDGVSSIYYIDATDADAIFNFVPLVGVQERLLTIVRLDASTNIITLTPDSTSELINGIASATMSGQFQVRDVHARNLTNWNII